MSLASTVKESVGRKPAWLRVLHNVHKGNHRWDKNESGCEADMLEGAEGGRHSPPRPQQEPINLKNEVSPLLTYYLFSLHLLTHIV
ncbi:jg20275 [Pararge aegeria aegeria]|uniref:Jg20275 protein n=1 Tax=Pararge aegeria aegeria TaxID=348720 RepID=A0A8S4R2J1_9NEOP|nr:jg20275 [Pararge aegeria aegeria]